MIGSKNNLPPKLSSSGSSNSQNPDMVVWAIELSFTPLLTFGIGFLIDQHFHTLPWFALGGMIFGITGSILRVYYAMVGQNQAKIGLVDQTTGSIKRRSIPRSSKGVDGEMSSSHSLTSVDLSISDELKEAAAVVDGASRVEVDRTSLKDFK